MTGRSVIDCAADEFARGCFGTAGYDDTSGLPQGALLASLGCGNPVAVAELRAGQSVLDLGSGGGIDVLLAARRVGPYGTAYGLDASPDMIELARRNAADVDNVAFLHGTIEDIPLPAHAVDAVISNCVVNLSDDKAAVLGEAFRVLRPGGRLTISDMVTDENVDPAAVQRLGCDAGTLALSDYRKLLRTSGFVNQAITLTVDHGGGVHSAIVHATKPAIGPGLEIRPMRDGDAGQVLAIYQKGLDTGQAGVETTAPSWEGFTESRLPYLRYVAVDTETNDLVGWVAASAASNQPAHAGVIEHSVYVHPRHQAHGIGRALLAAFITASEDAGIWTIQSSIFPDNARSLSLHQALGFRMVGARERIGRFHGSWRDVIMMERRSRTVGS
ncbi:GNAT family N-acetyltransferase [Nonomuraea sp. NPDC050643]|uniref:GNAT family N-acetyltransferase n=1 Tax=Nonomuraea sp. NPDC050643 TaxID=3155660 RepID=UPI0033CA8879